MAQENRTAYITEVLDEINKDIGVLYTTYKKSATSDGGPLGVLFYHAFTKAGKFDLPQGEPPYKPADEPMGMNRARFIIEISKFNIFTRRDLSDTRRQALFIQMLEAIHPKEAKILLAIKDQNLTALYPNITANVVAAAGFISLPPVEEIIQTKPQRKKPGPKKKQ